MEYIITIVIYHCNLLLDFSLLGKRSRSPPAYKGHRPEGGLALAPPCPPYGVKQPKEVRGELRGMSC